MRRGKRRSVIICFVCCAVDARPTAAVSARGRLAQRTGEAQGEHVGEGVFSDADAGETPVLNARAQFLA